MSRTDAHRPHFVIYDELGFVPFDFGAWLTGEMLHDNQNPDIRYMYDTLEPNHTNRKNYRNYTNRANRTKLRNQTRRMILTEDWDNQPEPYNNHNSAKAMSS